MIKKKTFNKSTVLGSIVVVLVFISLCVVFIKILAGRDLSLKWSKDIPDKINCHTLSYSGDMVGIGTDTGFCYVYNQVGKKVFEKKFPFPILSLKFSYNNNFLYIKGSSLFAVDLSTQKIVWEKFKKDYIVDDFWVFRDGSKNGRFGILMRSKKDITRIYQYLDQKGQTIKEFVLPEIFGNCSLSASVDGKYLFLSLQEGDLYLFQSDSMAVWNIHLDPPVKEVNNEYPGYPIFQTVTQDGSVCLAYIAEEYGKDLFISELINNKGSTLWKNNLSSPITGLMMSPDEKKILVTTQNKFIVNEISGKTLYSQDQFGYKPSVTRLGTSNVLVGFLSSEESNESEKNTLVFKLISLNRKQVLWQKRTGTDALDFSIGKNGYVFVEISLHRVKLYRYVLK